MCVNIYINVSVYHNPTSPLEIALEKLSVKSRKCWNYLKIYNAQSNLPRGLHEAAPWANRCRKRRCILTLKEKLKKLVSNIEE